MNKSYLAEYYERILSSKTATVFVVSLALFTDMISYGIVIPILPKIVEGYGGNKTDVGWLVGAYGLGLFTFTPVFGILSDYYQNRKFFMSVGLIGLMVANAVFPFAHNFTQLFIARIAQGISSGASWSIGLSMISDVSPSAEVGIVMGTVMSANVFGQLSGPPLGGILYKFVSHEAPFIFCAGLALVDLLARLLVRTPQILDSEAEDEQRQILVNESLLEDRNNVVSNTEPVKEFGIVAMLLNYSLLLMCANTATIGIIYSGFEAVFTLYAKHYFGMDEFDVGLLFTAIVIPNIFLSIAVGYISNRYGNWILCSIGVITLGIACPLISIPSNSNADLFGEIACLMMLGATGAIGITPVLPEISKIVESNGGSSYGQVYALFNMSYSVGMIVGPIVASHIYEKVNIVWALLFFTFCSIPISLLLFIQHLRSAKNYLIHNGATHTS